MVGVEDANISGRFVGAILFHLKNNGFYAIIEPIFSLFRRAIMFWNRFCMPGWMKVTADDVTLWKSRNSWYGFCA